MEAGLLQIGLYLFKGRRKNTSDLETIWSIVCHFLIQGDQTCIIIVLIVQLYEHNLFFAKFFWIFTL